MAEGLAEVTWLFVLLLTHLNLCLDNLTSNSRKVLLMLTFYHKWSPFFVCLFVFSMSTWRKRDTLFTSFKILDIRIPFCAFSDVVVHCTVCLVTLYVVYICYTVAFSWRVVVWIIYATNEFARRCRCSSEDMQGTFSCLGFHHKHLLVSKTLKQTSRRELSWYSESGHLWDKLSYNGSYNCSLLFAHNFNHKQVH